MDFVNFVLKNYRPIQHGRAEIYLLCFHQPVNFISSGNIVALLSAGLSFHISSTKFLDTAFNVIPLLWSA